MVQDSIRIRPHNRILTRKDPDVGSFLISIPAGQRDSHVENPSNTKEVTT